MEEKKINYSSKKLSQRNASPKSSGSIRNDSLGSIGRSFSVKSRNLVGSRQSSRKTDLSIVSTKIKKSKFGRFKDEFLTNISKM